MDSPSDCGMGIVAASQVLVDVLLNHHAVVQWFRVARVRISLTLSLMFAGDADLSVARLQRERATLRCEQAENAAVLRSRLKSQRRACTRAGAAIESHSRHAMLILALSAPWENTLKAYAAQVTVRPEDADELTAAAIRMYLDLDDAALENLMDPSSDAGTPGYASALKFSIDFEVHEWIFDQNDQKGIAPTPDDVIQHRERLESELRGEVQPADSRGKTKWGNYKWLSRLKRKWRLRGVRPVTRDHIPHDLALLKVTAGRNSRCVGRFTQNPLILAVPVGMWGRLGLSKRGAHSGTQNGTARVRWCDEMGP